MFLKLLFFSVCNDVLITFYFPHQRPTKTLPSLADLWSDGERPAAKSAADTKLLQKYEEERCRRQVNVFKYGLNKLSCIFKLDKIECLTCPVREMN